MSNEALIGYLKDAIKMEGQLSTLNRVKMDYERKLKDLEQGKNSMLEEKEFFDGTIPFGVSYSPRAIVTRDTKVGFQMIHAVDYDGQIGKLPQWVKTTLEPEVYKNPYNEIIFLDDRYLRGFKHDLQENSRHLFSRELPRSSWNTEEMKTLLKNSSEYYRDNIKGLNIPTVSKSKGSLRGILAAIVPLVIAGGVLLFLGNSGVKSSDIPGLLRFVLLLLIGMAPFVSIYLYSHISVGYRPSSTTDFGRTFSDNYWTWIDKYEKPIYEHMNELREADIVKKREWHQERIDVLTPEYNEILKHIDETRVALDKIYAKDFIHPKYQNFVAVAQIYDYLTTGRCDELTGAHGAYNLFESELRQNIIIEKLDIIIDQLGALNRTMYTVCSEIQRTNTLLSGISSYLGHISTSMTIVANNSSVIAYNTQCIKNNTDIMNRYY